MKTAIVGFAGGGKTTVFNSLTGLEAGVGYGARERANLGSIKVPDTRVEFLAAHYSPRKKTLAEIDFVDVAGPQGAGGGGGFDTALLEHMGKADALVHVIRGFEQAGTPPPDPPATLAAFEGELMLSDQIRVENRLARLAKEGAKGSAEHALMERLRDQLERGRPLRLLELSEAEERMLGGYQFVSLKPCLALLNRDDEQAGAGAPDSLAAAAAEAGVGVLSMAARVEAEIARLAPADQPEFLADLGLAGCARERFIGTVYSMLDLISFLTSGEDECRAWTIRRGTSAQRAAGKIHSDIERGFIRAEVVAFTDFQALGSEAKCREAGKLRLEGKTYVVADGDIVNFRFNV